MPGRPTLISKVVPAAEILRALEAFPAFLLARGIEECSVMHGWGSDLPIDALWKPMKIPIPDIAGFVSQAIERRDFLAGDSDFYLELTVPCAEFLFCHESDIHLKTEDQELMRAFREFLEGLGIPVIHAST